MIRLEKHEEPEILKRNAAAWREQYLEARAEGAAKRSGRRSYGRSEIKAVLMAESCGKCVYCESKVTHVSPGDVEHILPVAKRPELVCEWTNLAFACNVCNNTKRDYYDEDEPLINPFLDEPELHIRFLGALVFPVPNDSKGYLTVRKLGLDRQALMERRVSKLEALSKLVRAWAAAEGRAREAIAEEILAAAGRDEEYTAASVAFLALVEREFGYRFSTENCAKACGAVGTT